MKKKNIICILVVVFILATTICFSSALACKHETSTVKIAIPATCTEVGEEEIVCVKCGGVLETREIPATGHTFGTYELTEAPTADKNGIETSICEVCGATETREYICQHSNTTEEISENSTCIKEGTKVITCIECGKKWEEKAEFVPHDTETIIEKEATCTEEGLEKLICKNCGKTVEEHEIPKVAHTFEECDIYAYATPTSDGLRHFVCTTCNQEIEETFSITLKNNMLYIPGADILSSLTDGELNQTNLDNNDIVYTENAYSVPDNTNPFVFGKNDGSMKNLSRVLIGEYIYLCVDGNIEKYEVLVSEKAVKNGDVFIGKTSKINLWNTYSSSFPSNETYNGSLHNGTNCWENVDDGKTLHLFSCDNLDSGSNSFIVLANLVGTQPLESQLHFEG